MSDPTARRLRFEKQIADFKATVARYEKDPQDPEDSMEAIQERAKEASETRELANRRLGHYELGSGLTQIAIVLASAAIITGNHRARVVQRCTLGEPASELIVSEPAIGQLPSFRGLFRPLLDRLHAVFRGLGVLLVARDSS